MHEVALFCEDSFHEKFVGALCQRFAREYRAAVKTAFRSARGGLPRMHAEFRDFLPDLSREREPHSGWVVLADANCEGYNGRKTLMDGELDHYPQFEQLVSYAFPDPYIERWMLVDHSAFR